MGGAEARGDLEAVHTGHAEIDQGNLWLERACGLDPHRTRVRQRHGVMVPEGGGESGGGIHVVVHDENALRAVALPGRRLRSLRAGHNVRQRQTHDELAAGPGAVAFRFDRAPVQLDEAADQRETDPETALRAIERDAPLHEQIEYTRQGVGGDAVAIIANVNVHLFRVGAHHRADGDVTALRSELDGIVDQVADHLLEPDWVGEHDDRRRGKLDRDLLLRRLDRRPQRVHRARHQLAKLDALGVELNLAMADARDVQQVVHHPADVAQLTIEHLVCPLRRLRVQVLRAHHLDDVGNGGERVAQLVGQHGDELVLALVGGAEPHLGLLQRRDVEGGAGIPGKLPRGPELRHGDRHHPAVLAIRAAETELVLERQRALDDLIVGRGVPVAILRMQEVGPGVPQHFVGFDTQEFEVRLVDVFHAFEAAHPDEHGGAVHQGTETRFAAPQRRLHFLALPDVFRDPDRERRCARCIRNAEAVQLHPDRLAVPADIARLAANRGHESGPNPIDILAVRGEIVGVRDVLGAECKEVFTSPAGQFTELVVHTLEAALEIGLENAHRRAVVHDPQPLRAHPQRFHVLPDRVDVDERDHRALDVVFGGPVGADP